MVLIVSLVLLVTVFILSYNNFRKETYKTDKERIKSKQVFVLSWFLVIATAVAVYFCICYFTGQDFIPSV